MRIVAVADTHLYHDELVLPPGDLFIHAGDLCRRGTMAELVAAAAWIQQLPYRRKVVVAGNHDWPFVHEPAGARRRLGDGVVYLEDAEANVDGLRVYGSPWQPEFNEWAFNLPRGAPLAERWKRIPPGLDVLVTHGPPAGIGDRSGMEERAGCADLRERVFEVRPRLHLFGHIHGDRGVWVEGGTTFVNCTTSECMQPVTVIEMDAVSGRVEVQAG